MKKWLTAILLLLALTALTACSAPSEQETTSAQTQEVCITIAGISIPLSTETLDLREADITSAEFDALQSALPACSIRWSVPIQGQRLDSASASLTLSDFSQATLDALGYFPALSQIDARACADSVVIYALRAQFPACELIYNVSLGGETYPQDTTALTLADLDTAQFSAVAPLLPQLNSVTLTEVQTDVAPLLEAMDAFPDISFSWQTELYGVSIDAHAEFLDFSRIEIDDLDAFERIVSRLPDLKQVDMCRCGIADEEMDALNRRYENIKFVWEIRLSDTWIRTDTKALIPITLGLWIDAEKAEKFRYLTDMECLDLGHNTVERVEFLRYMPKLKYLILAEGGVSDLSPLEGLSELVYLEIFLNPITDYTPLLSLSNLESLNISYTNGQPEVIAQMQQLKFLRWANNDERRISKAQEQFIRDSLPDTYIEIVGRESSTGGQWREHQNYYDMRDALGRPYMVG